MKKANYLAKAVSLLMAGILLTTGCGSSAEDGSKSDAATAADGAVISEDMFPESTGEAADNAGSEMAGEGSAADNGGPGPEAAGEAAATDSADNMYSDAARTDADMGYDGLKDEMKEMESRSADSYLESVYEYDWEPGYPNTEEYSRWEEQGFYSVMKAPLSTFAADVDTASYSNLRRLINSGYKLDELPQGAVRIEEMINYFSYDYNAPKGMEPFGVTTQISTCPWNDDAELLMIGLKTEDIDYSQAPASNLVFLLDVSGSMYTDDKLPLLKESFGLLAKNLTKKDRISKSLRVVKLIE